MPEVVSMEDPDGNELKPEEAAVSNPVPEEITPDTELFPGGPTKAQIDAWIEQYGGKGSVYVTEVAEEKYIVWRTLRRAEYRTLVNNMEARIANGASNAEATMDNEEEMTRMCTLWPTNQGVTEIAAGLAGVPSIISQQIMEASGFLSLQVREL